MVLLAFLAALATCLLAQQPVTPLFKLVDSDDKAGLVALLANRPAEARQRYLGRTPLHLAALDNHTQQLADLLEAGADLEAQDDLGRTPLHLAVFARRSYMAQLLLRSGADAQARDQQDATPLHLAAWVGAPLSLWRAFLQAGADPQARDAQGRTPLGILTHLYPAWGRAVETLPEMKSAPGFLKKESRAAWGAVAYTGSESYSYGVAAISAPWRDWF